MRHCPRRTDYTALRNWLSLVFILANVVGCATLHPIDRSSGEIAGRSEPQPVITPQGAAPDETATALIEQAAGAQQATTRKQLDELSDAVRRAIPVPLTSGNQVTPLIDGPAAFTAMNAAIDAARTSIHVETYLFSADNLGRAFAERLMRKAREGVEVRLIYDAVGSIETPDNLFDELRAAGVQVAKFRPLNLIKTLPWRYHNRDHRKLLVVDGRVAFTGGLNISGAYAAGSISHPGPDRGLTTAWRDTHVQIEGPAAQQFQTIFLETWTRLGSEVDSHAAKYFPISPAYGGNLVAAVVSNGARQRNEDIYTAYLAAVKHASREILITQAYFAPPPDLTKALFDAVKRGVDVRVLLPGFTDSSPVFYASHAGYDNYLQHGVRLYIKMDALLHAKTMVIDGALSVIGTANLDYRSFLHNNEVTALIIGKEVADRMRAVFKRDIADAHELTLTEWRKRSPTERLKETLSHWFNYWL
jgi:cardiolipin synthase